MISVFTGVSIDGYIADKEGGLAWLESVPNPNQDDCGYLEFTSRIDAILMGRNTFETVCGFNIPWQYKAPVFVWSSRLKAIPEKFKGKAELVNGSANEIVAILKNLGYKRLYIDGGKTVQTFLREDLVDELTLTTVPVLLGGGIPLFGELDSLKKFQLKGSKVYLNQLVQNVYKRERL